MERLEKKIWSKPELEALHINMTMTGNGGTTQDGMVFEPGYPVSGDESFPTHGPFS